MESLMGHTEETQSQPEIPWLERFAKPERFGKPESDEKTEAEKIDFITTLMELESR